MAIRTASIVISLMALILAIKPVQLIAEEPPQLSHTELRRLVRNANSPADYRKLSLYFHYQAQLYRAKANVEMRDYAKYFSIYHPKFPTGADTAARLYESYSAKSDKEEKLAARYDELLMRNGVAPPSEAQIISITDLGNQRPKEAATSVLPQKKDQAERESNTPREKQ